MTFCLGLTGSIGMGKSTTAAMFADLGCAVWDADAAVRGLYAPGGAAVDAIGAVFPDAIRAGGVSREVLRAIIQKDTTALHRLETITHPLVRADRARFARSCDAPVAVFDIPLLFETGSDAEMDATACVTVSRETQRARVLARGTMTEADLDHILARQMPNAEKCARATYVIETDTLEHARAQVQTVYDQIIAGLPHA